MPLNELSWTKRMGKMSKCIEYLSFSDSWVNIICVEEGNKNYVGGRLPEGSKLIMIVRASFLHRPSADGEGESGHILG